MKDFKEQAEKLKALGSPLSIDELIAFLEKKEAGKAKREKRREKRWREREEREKVSREVDARLAKMTDGERANYFEEIQRRSILNQRPSSLR